MLHPKIHRPRNYNPDTSDIFVYVEPVVTSTDEQDHGYEVVSTNHAYANYWSNNWRKTHGYPLKRKSLNKHQIYLKPILFTKSETKTLRDLNEHLKRTFQ